MNLIWLVVAIAFAIGEMLTVSLTLIWFSIGAIVLMFLSSFIESLFLQILIFSVISVSLLVFATKKLVKKDKDHKYDTNLQATIKKKGIVLDSITETKVGIVEVEGEKWSAISVNDNIIEAGTVVDVLKIEGVKLIVEKSENN